MTDRHLQVPAGAREALEAWRAETRRPMTARDPMLGRVLAHHAPALAAAAGPELEAFATRVATDLADWAEVTNRDEHLPRLERWDALGHRREDVEFHPDYHRMGEVIYGSRIMADYAVPGRELTQLAKFLLAGTLGEAGHLCPLACTAGLIKILQQKGSSDLKARYLPGLLDPSYETNLIGAQFVTEIQGGSDVGATAVMAPADRDRPGAYRLTGEKWFCSVINADLFLVAARVEDGPDGTRGVGCFLVPRKTPEGSLNRFAIRRLKRKLGTRSMASAEVDWDGALGFAIGSVEEGFKNLVGIVLHTSRIVNALGCAGSMLRAYADAEAFARHRRAFGVPIASFPSTATTLARMKATTYAAIASGFHLVAMGERVGGLAGEDPPRMAWRTLVNANKLGTALDGTALVRDGMEVLGGNGTIEDFSVLPRLFRDAMVFESWEGAHNVLAAQVARDAGKYQAHRHAAAEVGELLRGAPAGPARRELEGRLEQVVAAYDAALAAKPEVLANEARGLLLGLQETYQGACLLALAKAHPALADVAGHWLDLRPLPARFGPDPARVRAVLSA